MLLLDAKCSCCRIRQKVVIIFLTRSSRSIVGKQGGHAPAVEKIFGARAYEKPMSHYDNSRGLSHDWCMSALFCHTMPGPSVAHKIALVPAVTTIASPGGALSEPKPFSFAESGWSSPGRGHPMSRRFVSARVCQHCMVSQAAAEL